MRRKKGNGDIMKFYIVDVFAEEKYQGNQLAVFLADSGLSGGEMQKIAREMNFSETTFIILKGEYGSGAACGSPDGGGSSVLPAYDVRIFTPDIEVPFAGHPTLGSAYVIHRFLEGGAGDGVTLNLGVGPIPVTVDGSGGLTMSQNEPVFGEEISRAVAAELIGIGEDDIRADYPAQIVSTGLPCLVIPVGTLEALKRCAVNHTAFRRFIEEVLRCNLLMFTPGEEHDLRVRLFMDDPGYLEDPATGSAAGNLAGYLLKYDWFGSKDISYTAGQGHEIGRPSLLLIKAALENGKYTIKVTGNVKLIAQGEWE
jgi:trans-2,3-dihydro-3-hydroxyanthranilate isomerase